MNTSDVRIRARCPWCSHNVRAHFEEHNGRDDFAVIDAHRGCQYRGPSAFERAVAKIRANLLLSVGPKGGTA